MSINIAKVIINVINIMNIPDRKNNSTFDILRNRIKLVSDIINLI